MGASSAVEPVGVEDMAAGAGRFSLSTSETIGDAVKYQLLRSAICIDWNRTVNLGFWSPAISDAIPATEISRFYTAHLVTPPYRHSKLRRLIENCDRAAWLL